MAPGTSSTAAIEKVQNIYIIGAQSTGKTTLVDALAAYFERRTMDTAMAILKPKVIKEVARGVLQRHHFKADDIVTSKCKALELQKLILEAQAEAETRASDGWYISDRSGVDPLAYTRRYVGFGETLALKQESPWQHLEEKMKAGLIILCEAGGEWLVDDGIRLMPEDRAAWLQMHTIFCEVLDDAGIKYSILPPSIKDLQSRVNFVVTRWKGGLDTRA
ncbi:hypothetical protein MMC21_008406 [Puttea exsequens]|nr:hypothetical protein [Puttea exsequens]